MSLSKIDALLKKLRENEATSSGLESGVDWHHFEREVRSAEEKLNDVLDEISHVDRRDVLAASAMTKLGYAIASLGDALEVLGDHKSAKSDVSRSLRRVRDEAVSAGHSAISLAALLANPDGTDRIREP